MHALRAAVGLTSLLASGCLIGFDAGSLTGGGHPSADSGTGMTGAADTPADMGSSACVDFSSYAGMPLPNWVDGRGTWRVVTMAAGNVLMQTTGTTSRHDVFVAWQGVKDYADVNISATATLAITNMNCVLVRIQDALNYYALCVNDVGGRGPPAQEWRLNVTSAGSDTELASGSIATTDTHAFSLRVQGSTLYPIVDGDAKPAVTNGTFTHGAAGVSTDDQGGFMSLCTVPL
jgi:hypothetical protein